MVSIGVSKLGKTSVVFIGKGRKLNQEYYCNHALTSLIAEIYNLADNDYVFMQDGARSHIAKLTVEYLNSHVPEFMKPDSQLPSSPMGYHVWSQLKSMVYAIKITDAVHLKQRIIDCWKEIPQEEINKAIDAFRRRLRKVIKVNGERAQQFKF